MESSKVYTKTTYYLMSRIELINKAIAVRFWIGAKYSKRCIHRFKHLASYLLLLVSIIGWKKYCDRMRKANLKSRLTDLPYDLIESILLRLPTKSISRMQCSSKAFSSIINNPLFVSLHMSRVLNNGMNFAAEVPQFILFDRSRTDRFEMQLQPLKYNGKSDFTKSNYSFLFTKSNYSFHVSKILSVSLYDVEFVFHNLLFFKPESILRDPSYLVNPFKGEVLMIPSTETDTEYDTHLSDWYGMGFDSTTNTYKIVHAYKDREYHQLAAQVYVLRPKTSCSWRVIQSVPPSELSIQSVCAYGDMHWLVKEGSYRDIGGGRSHIISFDFKKEEFYWTPHPTLEEVCNNKLFLNDFYLLNMKGSMTIVDVSSSDYIEIWVMKDYSKKEWSLDYKINMQKFVDRPWDVFRYYTCGEWEKGIFFVDGEMGWDQRRSIVYYMLDLQQASIKRKKKFWSAEKIFCYTGSFISLKHYGDLVESTTQKNVWNFDM